MPRFDLIVRGGTLVLPKVDPVRADVAVLDGKIAAIANHIPESDAKQTIAATGKVVFPGAIDSHFHVGIYRPFSEDAHSESASAASGGVTSLLSYFRTGKSYLNKVGPYREIFPELMTLSDQSFHIDYGYHIALMNRQQLEEAEWLVRECGVSTFKYYMFYKGIDLSGSERSADYVMQKEPLDLGFLYLFMKKVAALNEKYANAGGVRLSIHCENPEIIPVTVEEVKHNSSGNVMEDYSRARPGWQEALAIAEVGVIANQTGCPVNLLHLTSREAIDASLKLKRDYPQLDVMMEATLHHLGLSTDNDYGVLGKVNPPIRDSSHVDYLWQSTLRGDIQTVVSDHACSIKKLKTDNLWTSMPGFGGTSLMFPVLLNEGYHKRGLSLERIAALCATNPARIHNLYPQKGAIQIGADADLAIVDIEREQEVKQELLCTAQDFSPFIGMKLKGWPEMTILRGQVIFDKGKIVGKPGDGRFLRRPVALHR